MATQSIEQLKQWFKTGNYPTQQQFYDWLDSFRHNSSLMPMSEVYGLLTALQGKADVSSLNNLLVLINTEIQTRAQADAGTARLAANQTFTGVNTFSSSASLAAVVGAYPRIGSSTSRFGTSYFNQLDATVINTSSIKPVNAGVLSIGAGTISDFNICKAGDITTPQVKLKYPSGNVIIQDGGTFTDSGSRLQVAATIEVKGIAGQFILASPNGTRYKITVDNSGVLIITSI